MKKYIIVSTWNGEGYTSENFINEIVLLDNDAQALVLCKALAEDQLGADVTIQKNGAGFDHGDDQGAYHFFELKDEHYGVRFEPNWNKAELLTEAEYKAVVAELRTQIDEEDGIIDDGDSIFFHTGEIKDGVDVQYEVDYQFEVIKRGPDVDNLEFVDCDNLEFETYRDTTTGKHYTVPLELVRDWDNIQEVK